MSSEQQTSGLMTFYDNYVAPLKAGSYRFVLQQTVSLEGEQPRHYYQDQSFEVVAPRYSIDSDEIQARFPPSGGVGDYKNNLPHLVLRTRNLPWERRVWEDTVVPWLALLVLSEQDIKNGNAVAISGTVADLEPHRADDLPGDDTSLKEWWRLADGGSVLLPRFIRREDRKTSVRLLDLDLKLFLELCPRLNELPLLAHIRHVDTADKVPLEMVANGEFSVLVANRFPADGANTVYLISLEGWDELLKAPSQPQPASRIRLITLGSWSFVHDTTGQDTFSGLMQQLKDNSAVFGITLPASTGEAYVDNALKGGYVPLDYQPLESTPGIAWYRGPLAPLVRPRWTHHAFERADAALIFDDTKGMLDLSYAAAWELGRLLALASPAFSKGLSLFVERYQNAAELANQIKAFIDLHRTAFKEFKLEEKLPGTEDIAIADELVQWIAQLVLLYPVPFQYLVPHPSLLPPESVRFFHLDDNWVDALVEGALSSAVRDIPKQDQTFRADLQPALSEIVYQYRLRLLRKDPQRPPSEPYMKSIKSGFLLRSSIVTDWPGVEVKATTSTTLSDPFPDILRFDQIAEGVLFCLARGALKDVTFREPREGLTFGIGTNGTLEARKSKKILNVRQNLLRTDQASDGVVNIAELRNQLASQGSAEFAVEMIRQPEEQVIMWGV